MGGHDNSPAPYMVFTSIAHLKFLKVVSLHWVYFNTHAHTSIREHLLPNLDIVQNENSHGYLEKKTKQNKQTKNLILFPPSQAASGFLHQIQSRHQIVTNAGRKHKQGAGEMCQSISARGTSRTT